MKPLFFLISIVVFSSMLVFCTNQEQGDPNAPIIKGVDNSPYTIPYYQRDTSIDKISFASCDVERASELLETESYLEVLTDNLITTRGEKERLEAIYAEEGVGYSTKENRASNPNYKPKNLAKRTLEAAAHIDAKLINTSFHPFVEVLHRAYAKHYPVTISPDMIWLMIAQGFANHVNENAEKLRSQFVDFDGKKQLDIRRDEFVKGSKNNDWMGAFDEFAQKIEANTGKGLLDLITSDFTTTGPIEKAAFQVTLMDAMKSYFDYSMTTACGIPEITLEGSVEDWKAIEKKAAALAQYDLAWWIDELMPVLKEFTKAAEGNADKEFWESIYKWNHRGSGNPYVTGWILKFFPYKKQGDKLMKFVGTNKSVDEETGETVVYDLQAGTDDFPSGVSLAPFIWNYHGTFYKMEFAAGFVGFQQDSTTLSLRPEISWAVIDLGKKANKQEIKNYEEGGNEAYRKGK